MKKLSELQELLNSKVDSEIERGLSMEDDIKSLANKYSSTNGYKGDLNLKKPIHLESRDSDVYAFYVYQGWIYLIDEDGADIDPYDVEEEFLKTFTDYIADERNVIKG